MLTATTTEQRQIATDRLNRYIAEGQKRAVGIADRIAREVPVDYLAPASRIGIEPTTTGDKGVCLVLQGRDGQTVRTNVGRYALGQLAEQCKMRMDYVDHLVGAGDWGRDLLARNLQDGIVLGHDGQRYLVRAVEGQARGFLSNKFRRLDARPILDDLVGEAQRAGAIVVDGVMSEVRCEMKFIVPRILEPAPGEFMVFGFAWGTSNYGAGANWMRAFANRLACFNGVTMEQNLRQVHIGRALSESDFEFSDRTMQLDTETARSATRDVARLLLSDAKIAATADVISRASANGIDPTATLASLKKKVSKKDSEAITTAFNSPDVVELPPGNTMWRFSNAISLVARDSADAENKLDLERLAGDVLKAA
jgi:hypothetical protein